MELTRARALFRTWLSRLATDADAVMAASALYEGLSAGERDAWLSAIEEEIPEVAVPKVALFAPFLGVETDEARMARMEAHVEGGLFRTTVEAFAGTFADGDRALFYVFGRHLDFVETLLCRLAGSAEERSLGIRSVVAEALTRRPELPRLISQLGVLLSPVPLDEATVELGHAVVADARNGVSLSPLLTRFTELFTVPRLA